MSLDAVQPHHPLDEAERRLALLERQVEIGELASGIAHDLNNVLATISVLSTMLRGGETDPKRLALVSQLEGAVANASRLTRTVLQYAGPGGNGPAEVELGPLVTEMTELVGRAAGSRIEVCLELEAKRRITGDRSRLAQVVLNLAVNARDAIEADGRVCFRTWDAELADEQTRPRPPLAPGWHVVLEVADSGPGIDPSIRDRIFEPYFTTKHDGPVRGTGLGLATAQRIVAQHRGFIEVVDGRGPGATLRATFPASPCTLSVGRSP